MFIMTEHISSIIFTQIRNLVLKTVKQSFLTQMVCSDLIAHDY